MSAKNTLHTSTEVPPPSTFNRIRDTTSEAELVRLAAMEALAHESMFNVVDTGSGGKADLIIRKSRRFSEVEFARRQPMLFEGTVLWVAVLNLEQQWLAARAAGEAQ